MLTHIYLYQWRHWRNFESALSTRKLNIVSAYADYCGRFALTDGRPFFIPIFRKKVRNLIDGECIGCT